MVELEIAGRHAKASGSGDGPVDAAYRTIAAMTETKSRLLTYSGLKPSPGERMRKAKSRFGWKRTVRR